MKIQKTGKCTSLSIKKIQTMSKLNPNLLVYFNSNNLCPMLYLIRNEV